MYIKTCANPNCKRGEGRQPRVFETEKEWGLYCSTLCGDAVRRLRHYYKKKEAAEGGTVYEYGHLRFVAGTQKEGWVNLFVDGPRGRISLWVIDTAQPTRSVVQEAIRGLHAAYFHPDDLLQGAGDDANRQQEARNLIKAAQEIGMPLLDAARLV